MGTKKTKFKITAAPIESYTARSLYEMKFHDAARVITRMDSMRKAVISSDVQQYLNSLYENANRFGNENFPLDEQPSMAQFRGIIGKIKHWETIMYWLYEIDILMEAKDLAELALEAEYEIEEAKAGRRCISPKELRKQTEHVEKAIKAPVPHTLEIMNQAAALAAAFWGK